MKKGYFKKTKYGLVSVGAVLLAAAMSSNHVYANEGQTLITDDELVKLHESTNENIQVLPSSSPIAEDKPEYHFSNGEGLTTPDKPEYHFSNGEGLTTPDKPTIIITDDGTKSGIIKATDEGLTTPDKPEYHFSNGEGLTTPDKPEFNLNDLPKNNEITTRYDQSRTHKTSTNDALKPASTNDELKPASTNDALKPASTNDTPKSASTNDTPKSEGNVLPNTGEKQMSALSILGFATLIGGLFTFKRRETNN